MSTITRVGIGTLVAIRYTMTNAAGEILADSREDEPVKFLFGSGEILPGLEGPLAGLRIGDQKSFSLSDEVVPGLNQTFYFDVIIDDVRWANEKELTSTSAPASNTSGHCGPGCDCD